MFKFGGVLEEISSSDIKVVEYFYRHGSITVFNQIFIPKLRNQVLGFKEEGKTIIFYIVKIKITVKYGRFEKSGIFNDGYTYRKKTVYSYKNKGIDIILDSKYEEPIACDEKAKTRAKEIVQGFAKFVASQE